MSLIEKKYQRISEALLHIPFAKNLGFKVIQVDLERVVIEMPIVEEQHANYVGVVHGGVIMSIADMAMGFACGNLGKLTTTLDMNINFIKSVKANGSLRAIASVLHNGRQTLVSEVEVYNGDGILAAKARGTFFVTGNLDEDK